MDEGPKRSKLTAEERVAQRAAILRRLRELTIEARYIARDNGWKITEIHLINALICTIDMESNIKIDL